MRKTDRKRRQIVEAAYRLFQSNGFDKTTMSLVTEAVGGSKATLYNYFSSKEELFVECVTSICDRYLAAAFAGLQDPQADLAATLLHLGRTTPRITCTPEMVAARRLMIAQSGRSGIGRVYYRKTMEYIDELAAFLGGAMKSGQLRKGDPALAAHQLRALVEAEILDRCLLDAETMPPSAAVLERTAREAVRLFFRIYALDRSATAGDTVPNSSE